MTAENAGVFNVETTTVDLSSLTDADGEPWVPEDNTGIADADGVAITGYDSSATYTVYFDHTNDKFVVQVLADGTDPTAGTDAGEVQVAVFGRR